MLDRVDKTIVAVASAPAFGPVGIVRMSGPDAVDIAGAMTKLGSGLPLSSAEGFSRHAGEVFIDDELTVPTWLYVFRRPRSYTRQDIVEFYAPGSPALLELVRDRALQLGAIAAQPGEFTARAFLSGAMDLTAAEAVVSVINAQTDAQLRAAHRMRDGELGRRIIAIRDQLAEALALVEADIDFAEEPIDFISPAELARRLQEIGGAIERLLATGVRTDQLRVEPTITLVGLPNVGKSSLMNRLCGVERAICEAVAGTTRDVLSAPVSLSGIPAMLLDTAGVDESTDEVIALARDMTLATARQTDLLCLVVDATAPTWPRVRALLEQINFPPFTIALNKCDIAKSKQLDTCRDEIAALGIGSGVCSELFSDVCSTVCVSAKTDAGIDDLRHTFGKAVASITATVAGESIVFSGRQNEAVTEAHGAVRRGRELSQTAIETIDCADLLAFELREALDALGSVTGDVTTDDLLGQIFSQFCIGK